MSQAQTTNQEFNGILRQAIATQSRPSSLTEQVRAVRDLALDIDRLQRIAADGHLEWDVREGASEKLRALLGIPTEKEKLAKKESEAKAEALKKAVPPDAQNSDCEKRIENQRQTISALQSKCAKQGCHIAKLTEDNAALRKELKLAERVIEAKSSQINALRAFIKCFCPPRPDCCP